MSEAAIVSVRTLLSCSQEYTGTDACGNYVGHLLCHQPPAAVGRCETRGRLPLLERVGGCDRVRRPSSEAVAYTYLGRCTGMGCSQLDERQSGSHKEARAEKLACRRVAHGYWFNLIPLCCA